MPALRNAIEALGAQDGRTLARELLGNLGTPEDADLLTRARDDPEPLVREHSAWALGRIGVRASVAGGLERSASEHDRR